MVPTGSVELDNESNVKKHNVVVTGFGLFRDHSLNPSWEAIRDGRLKLDRQDVNVITKQVPVAYEEVDRLVPSLWEEYKPLLTVHVGLAAFESSIRIEESARHGPFIDDDVLKCAPHKELREYHEEKRPNPDGKTTRRNYKCAPCDFKCSTTCINIDRVCDRLNREHDEERLAIPAKKSEDAGLYVCEYIYQKSLRICDRCVFIHVPNIDKFKLEDITAALCAATEFLVDEVLGIVDS